jgi:dihydroorotate dehydrogenase (NAD+) catalytic subunit
VRRRRPGGDAPGTVDLSTRVGSVPLANPVLTASGTSGHGAELGAYFPLRRLGAVVVKSVSADPWPGNPSPRLHPLPTGMINSVGLQGPGVVRWLEEDLPPLLAEGVPVIASIWGLSVEAYHRAALALADAPAGVVAVEVNVSCPNVEDRRRMFAHSARATAEVLEATAAAGRPRWAKLSPNVTDVTEIAAAAVEAGAEALTLVNTVMGMALDLNTGRSVLAAGGGGLSGPGIHSVAVRAVYECRAALPEVAIVGVGGVSRAEDVAELLMAGASAVEVGTVIFSDPRAPLRILESFQAWCVRRGISSVGEIVGLAHR